MQRLDVMTMPIDPLEDTLLRQVLTDPATGLPNRRYLTLVRNWEESLAERHGAHARIAEISVTGGSEESRRDLTVEICRQFRRSDFIASEGPRLLYVLLAVRDPDGDIEIIRNRIRERVRVLNDGGASPPLEVLVQLA